MANSRNDEMFFLTKEDKGAEFEMKFVGCVEKSEMSALVRA